MLIVISRDYGQLGNQLFLFAQFIAFSAEHGVAVANPTFQDYAGFFQTTSSDAWCRFPAKPSTWHGPTSRRMVMATVKRWSKLMRQLRISTPGLRLLKLGDDEGLDLTSERFMQLAKKPGLLFVRGWWFRDRDNFKKHIDTIRAYFAPVDAVADPARMVANRARDDGDMLVGVHMRQGDFSWYLGGRYYYPTPVYIDLMKQAVALFPRRRVRFVVCSNEPHTPEEFEGLPVMISSNSAVVDMHVLANCDCIIGPPSTFSLWASLIGKAPLAVIQRKDQPLTRKSFKVRTDGEIATHFEEPADLFTPKHART